MAKKKRIRSLVLLVPRCEDHIFVGENVEESTGRVFYRPLGGAIEFGEYAVDALRRELLEEINAEISGLHFLGTLENIFTFEGAPGHEIVLVFGGDFVDETRHALDYIVEGVDEGDKGERLLFIGKWMPLDFFRAGKAPLYPDALLELLDGKPTPLELL